MSIEIDLECPVPPAALLAAIREGARAWREQPLPDELQRRHLHRVEGRVVGSRFRLRFTRRWWQLDGDEWGAAELRARVLATPTGGSRVIGECARTGGLGTAAVALGAVALFLWLAGADVAGAAFLVTLMAAIALVTFASGGRAMPSTDAEARYLVERLERVVAAAGARAAGTHFG